MTVKKVNWFDHTANLLVVILGITIAFYLEAYKEDAKAKKLESQYIESLIQDLEVDHTHLDTLREINNKMSAALIKLSTASTGAPFEKDSLAYQLLMVQYNPPFEPQRTTYQSLGSSGRMDLISDFELRNSIVELYEQYYRGIRQYDDAIDQNLRDFYKPYYMKRVKFTGRFSVDEAFLFTGEFRNIIFAYRFLFQAKADFYGQVSDQIEGVLSDLKEYQTSL